MPNNFDDFDDGAWLVLKGSFASRVHTVRDVHERLRKHRELESMVVFAAKEMRNAWRVGEMGLREYNALNTKMCDAVDALEAFEAETRAMFTEVKDDNR